MTAELEKKVDIHNCSNYNNDEQTSEDKCKADDNCEYSQLTGFCSALKLKKFNITYILPDPARTVKRTLEMRNLNYIVNYNNNSKELKLEEENIHCLDWGSIPSKFTVNKTGNSISYNGEKCQEFIKPIAPKSLDGETLNEHMWFSLPSVGPPNIENDTLRFEIKEPQFQGCEKTLLRITCYYVNGTFQELGPFIGIRINVESLQGEEYEKCYAVAFMSGSLYEPDHKGRTISVYFTPSGQIYVNDKNKNMAITVASSVGGAIVGLVILGNIH